MPRRARFHKYPLVGRFAAAMRKRSYLWSFRTENIRPALYSGSILALLPFLGVQLPLALLASLLLRGNFMILGGLQFITTPVTAPAVYYGTYKLGIAVINLSGFGTSPAPVNPVYIAPTDQPIQPEIRPSLPSPPDRATRLDFDDPPKEIRWTRGLGTRINALLLGGLLAGLTLGVILDIFWRIGVSGTRARRERLTLRRSQSRPPIPPDDFNSPPNPS